MDLQFGRHYLMSPFATGVEALVAKARQTGALFVKCEPMTQQKSVQHALQQKKFSKSSHQLQPQKTIVVDTTDIQQTLARMKKKTQYNLRVAEKSKVVIRQEDAIDNFITLMRETTTRNKFFAHPDKYYKEIIKTKGVSLYTAFVGDNPTASAIVMQYQNTGTYLYGASAYAHRRYMSSFALQWYVMQAFAEQGVESYDLWGIDEEKWAGVTRFKRGFGGQEIAYIGSYDYPVKKLWYMVYKIKQHI